jgi:hypothetical protein
MVVRDGLNVKVAFKGDDRPKEGRVTTRRPGKWASRQGQRAAPSQPPRPIKDTTGPVRMTKDATAIGQALVGVCLTLLRAS